MVDDRITRDRDDLTVAEVKIANDGRKAIKKRNVAAFTSSGNLFACTICKKLFKNHLIYRKHIKIHAEKYTCHLCSKTFAVKQYFVTHMLSHSNEDDPLPYQCDFCSKSFSQKSHLNQHMKFHSNKKLYKCGECPKDFYQQEHLKAHMRQHTNERPFQCEVCDKSFNIKSSLQRHMNCHTGAKPFICDICNRGYTRRSVLVLHVQQVHENRKPYQCSVCEMCFSQKGNLQAHFKRKHLQPKNEGKRDKNKDKSRVRKQSYKHVSKVKKSPAKGILNSSGSFSRMKTTKNSSDCSTAADISAKLNSLQNGSLKSNDFTDHDSSEENCNVPTNCGSSNELGIEPFENSELLRFLSMHDEVIRNSLSDSNDGLPTFHNPYTFSSENFPDDIKVLSEFDMLLDDPKDWEDLLDDPDILESCPSGEAGGCSPSMALESPSHSEVHVSLPPCLDYTCPPWLQPSENGSLCQSTDDFLPPFQIKKEKDMWID